MLDPELLDSYNAVRTTPNTGIFCHAPFASVNFAQNGDATVCCYNRKYVLGTYPAATLDEIWHGAAARDLRRSMARNELPHGCDMCMSQFQSANFSGLRARSFDHLSEPTYVDTGEHLLSYPKLIEFEISNVCNLECTMCTGFFSSSIRHNREQLPPLKTPYDDAFVHQLEAFIPHLQEARFLGGEPFLIRTYYRIWDLIARLNPATKVSITTNATIVNERVRSVLDSLTANVIVSIDSLSRETYERIRVNADFDPAADKLLLLATFIVLTLPNIGLVNRLPLWLTILVISRDVGIVLTVAIVNLAVGPRTFRPSPLGKAATAIFIVACVVIMYFNYLGRPSLWVDAAIWASLVITLASALDYVWRMARIINR